MSAAQIRTRSAAKCGENHRRISCRPPRRLTPHAICHDSPGAWSIFTVPGCTRRSFKTVAPSWPRVGSASVALLSNLCENAVAAPRAGVPEKQLHPVVRIVTVRSVPFSGNAFLWELSPFADCYEMNCAAKIPCLAASLLSPFRVARVSRLIGKTDSTVKSCGWQVRCASRRSPRQGRRSRSGKSRSGSG